MGRLPGVPLRYRLHKTLIQTFVLTLHVIDKIGYSLTVITMFTRS